MKPNDTEHKPVKIYLSHSMRDYGSEYAEKNIDNLYSIYGDDAVIIDPSEYSGKCVDDFKPGGFMKNMAEVFHPLIESCDVFVALANEKTGRYTAGVSNEIKYAKGLCKKIWLPHGEMEHNTIRRN